MSATHVVDVLTSLAVARGNVNEAWRTLERLRDLARNADRALDDAEIADTRVHMAPDGPLGAAYLTHVGQQLDVLRQRCTLSEELAAQIEEPLDTAKEHIDTAPARLEGYDHGPETSPDEAAAVPRCEPSSRTSAVSST